MKAVLLSAVALAVSGPASVALAKPKRGAVLLDFSRPAAAPAPAIDPSALSSSEINAVSMAMARQFTGSAFYPGSYDAVAPVGLASRSLAGSLGNPFTIYSLSHQPYAAALSMIPSNPLECAMPAYRPNPSLGRSAEERRRVIFPLVQQVACEHGLPVGLFDALIMKESRYRATALSPKGAVGLSQLMPDTAHNLGVDAYTLSDNLRGGARYLKAQVNRFGRYDLALAAYNAGPGRVQRGWSVPRIAETQDYVRTIMGNWTGVAPAAPPIVRPISFRQAQLVFMPARPAGFAQEVAFTGGLR